MYLWVPNTCISVWKENRCLPRAGGLLATLPLQMISAGGLDHTFLWLPFSEITSHFLPTTHLAETMFLSYSILPGGTVPLQVMHHRRLQWQARTPSCISFSDVI